MHLVDDVTAARRACDALTRCPRVAVDIEGIDLCRAGAVCLLQAATPEMTTYVFDICALGRAAFDRGGLKELLENKTTEKIVYDGRADADALFHQFGVDLAKGRYCDVQYLYCQRHCDAGDPFLRGLGAAMSSAYWLSAGERVRLERVKVAGKRLFAPEAGGSYEVWRQRPLSEALLAYAAADVVHLHEMAARWQPAGSDVNAVAARRMRRACMGPQPANGRHMARKDFH